MQICKYLEQHRGEGFSLSDLERECEGNGEDIRDVLGLLEYSCHISKIVVAGVEYFYSPITNEE